MTISIDPVLAKRIKLVVLDVDGVMTDGGIVLGDVDGQRLELKRYDIQDGLGLHLLRAAGLQIVIITGRVSESVAMRSRELGAAGGVAVAQPHRSRGPPPAAEGLARSRSICRRRSTLRLCSSSVRAKAWPPAPSATK